MVIAISTQSHRRMSSQSMVYRIVYIRQLCTTHRMDTRVVLYGNTRRFLFYIYRCRIRILCPYRPAMFRFYRTTTGVDRQTDTFGRCKYANLAPSNLYNSTITCCIFYIPDSRSNILRKQKRSTVFSGE
jgi:hypothetical protein